MSRRHFPLVIAGATVVVTAGLGLCFAVAWARTADFAMPGREPTPSGALFRAQVTASQPRAANQDAEPKARARDDAGDKRRPTVELQLGHYAPVQSVAFSPDGKQVLTASSDQTARLWDAVSGLEIRSFQAQTSVNDAAFSPDGTQVITGHLDRKMARTWDTATGKLIRTFQGPDGPGSRVRFSPDGKHVLGTSAKPVQKTRAVYDYTVRLWNASSGAEVCTFTGHSGDVQSVAFSSDGAQVLTGSRDGTARLWATAGGKQIRIFRSPEGQPGTFFDGVITSVAFSPNGKWVLTGSTDKTARLWDAASGKQIHAFQGHAHNINSVAFSPDGKQVLTGSTDGTARLWNVASGDESQVLRGHQGEVLSVAFAPDGKQLLTGSTDMTARLWDAVSGKEIRAFAGKTALGIVNSLAFSPDGNRLLTGSGNHVYQREKEAGIETNKARLWDAVTGKGIRFIPNTKPVLSVAFSPDGAQMLTGSVDRTSSWETASGKELHSFLSPGGSRCLGYNSSGLLVVASGSGAQLWDMIRGKSIVTFTQNVSDNEIRVKKNSKVPPPLVGISSAGISLDGKRVITTNAFPSRAPTHVISLWDATSGNYLRTFGGHIGGDMASRYSASAPMALSPDGSKVLTGSFNDNNTVRLWDAISGEEISAFKGHETTVTSFVFSSDGTKVLTGSNDHTARLWDAARGTELRTFRGHTHNVTSVAFSPDGKRVATASWDQSARIWDMASGQELCRLLGFGDDSFAAVTPDNYYMASREALQGVAFSIGNRAFPFDQFDLRFNRPDKVMERLGLASPQMIAAYKQAYEKRLKRMNFTEDMLSDDFHLPEVTVNPAVLFSTGEKALKLKVRANDSKYTLDRLHVDVNGVPIHGANGLDLRQAHSMNWEQQIELELSPGRNRVDVSVLNERGAESLKETYTIECNAPARKPDLYVVAVGVSDYQDSRLRLTYADKDARDLADLLQTKRGRFGEVNVLRILNRDATRENIGKARDFLKASQVDDLVVLFFAGHGLLDSKLDYYFGTSDIDFSDPAKRGLAYEAIEDLLDGIRSRKKLLLMDTCHSGELDKDNVVAARTEKKPGDEVKERTFRGLTRVTSRVGLGNSFQLLQAMFADLRRGTGTVVIASAAGSEFAVESAAWNNGVFTHAVMRGLKGEADRDGDGRVLVSELRDFVEHEVQQLTAGRQSPTARRENLVIDFTFD
jgi:WD40 repeat protein/uncharacterized caspase-like protein